MRLVRDALFVVGTTLAAACARPDPCTTLPHLQNDTSPDAVLVRLHIENHLHDYFEPAALCVIVDEHVVFQATPELFAAALAKHRSVDIAMKRKRGGEHRVTLRVRYVGRGRPLDGYRFDIEASHRFTGGGDVFARIVEGGGPLTPFEQRPIVEWADPEPASAVANGVEN